MKAIAVVAPARGVFFRPFLRGAGNRQDSVVHGIEEALIHCLGRWSAASIVDTASNFEVRQYPIYEFPDEQMLQAPQLVCAHM